MHADEAGALPVTTSTATATCSIAEAKVLTEDFLNWPLSARLAQPTTATIRMAGDSNNETGSR
jgi:hypothetical protein